MKIGSLKIKGLFSADFDAILRADDISAGCDEIFCSAFDMAAVMKFLFTGDAAALPSDGTAECEFTHGGARCFLSRTKSFDTVASLLRVTENGKTQRYTDVDGQLALALGDVKSKISAAVIEANEFRRFNDSPTADFFPEIAAIDKALADSAAAVRKAADKKRQLRLELQSALAAGAAPVRKADVEKAAELEDKLKADYLTAIEEARGTQDRLRKLNTAEFIEADIATTKDHISRLKENSGFIDEKRAQLVEHDKIQAFLPELKEILSYRKKLAGAEQKAKDDEEELGWLKSQREGITSQLEELESDISRKTEQNTRLLLIKNDSESVDSIMKRNEELADRITALESDKEALEQVRDEHRKAIETIDAEIEEVKGSLKAIDVPVRSINELVENVRLSVRIKEAEDRLRIIDDEMAQASQQMTERESDIKKAGETVTALMDIDAQVTPFKSKDTILQILQAKINKNEVILQSLSDKQNNLREEIQNLHYKEIEIDQSADCLQTILAQKQYDRDIVIKKQAISEQQALPLAQNGTMMVAPTTAAFIDEHIESLKSDIVRRSNKKTEIVARQAGLKYALNEVERQKQIVLGDIVACRNERDAVVRRFKELAKSYDGEAAAQYFRALDTGSVSGFLMDAQRSLTEKQTRLSLIKENYAKLEKQKKETATRIGALTDTQKAVDVRQLTVEMMVESNEQVKTALMDVTEKLTALHTRRKAESDTAESAEIRLNNLVSVINETMNEKKANEREILKINRKVSAFVKTDASLEQLSSQERMNELMSEKKVLEDSLAEMDEKILEKAIETEKDRVSLENLREGYSRQRESAAALLKELGEEDVESLKLKNLSAETYASLKEGVERFDATLAMLESRLKRLEEMLAAGADAEREKELAGRLAEIKEKIRDIGENLAEAAEQRRLLAEGYVETEKSRNRLLSLIGRYEENSALSPLVRQSEMAGALLTAQINKIFAAATALYADMGGSGAVTAENGTIALTDGENTTPFGKLPLTDKVCLFIAVKLCLQKASFPELETVLLHGEITLDKEETATRLGGLKDKNFIVEAMSASV